MLSMQAPQSAPSHVTLSIFLSSFLISSPLLPCTRQLELQTVTVAEKESLTGPQKSWKGLKGGHNRGSGSKVKAPSGPK